MSKRNGFPGRSLMIEKLAARAREQFFEVFGSKHKAIGSTLHYQYRLEASSLANIKQEYQTVFRRRKKVEPLRPRSED